VSKHAHIIWPAVIVALLLLSGITTFAVLFASRSDGGAQVIDNYYQRSVAWDSVATITRASDSLGWNVNVTIRGDTPHERTGTVVITDRAGQAIEGLAGTVTVTRPQSAVTFGTHRFVRDDSVDTRYLFEFPYSEPGLWDLDVVASGDGERFVKRVRIEI
jgi:nitrogen fixation protein FixH